MEQFTLTRINNNRIQRLLMYIFVFLLPPLVTGAQSGQDLRAENNVFTEKLTLVSRPPEGTLIYFESFRSNPSLTKIVYVAGDGKGMRVVIDKNFGKVYDHIARGYPLLEPQTDTVAYLADKGSMHYAVIGDWESPAYDGACCLCFSPNGKHVVYLAQTQGSQFVVFNKVPLGKYDMIDQQTGVLFSPDSSHTAFIAVKDGMQRVVSDGNEQPPFDSINQINYSPNSRQLAYIGVRDKAYYIVRGEKTIGPFDIAQDLAWSPDGNTLTAVAINQDRWIIIKNDDQLDAGTYNVKVVFDKRTDQYGTAVPVLTPPGFSPDSSKFAYVRTDGVQYQTVVNDKTGSAFDMVSDMHFSPDSSHFVHIGFHNDTAGTTAAVVLDGKPGSPYEEVLNPIFSPDSRHLAYSAHKGDKWLIVADLKEGPSYDGISNPFFSPDSKHLVYAALKEGKWRIVIDQKEGQPYDGVTDPFFSLDSSTLVYRAMKNGKFCIVKNGREQKYYDTISLLVFSPDSSEMAYRAKDGDAWLMIRNQQEGKRYKTGPSSKIALSRQQYTPDGKHLVYMTGNAGDKMKIVVDEQEGTSSFIYLSQTPIIFDSVTHLHTLVGKIINEQAYIYRLDIDIK